MKRFGYLVVLMAFSPSAYAGNFSFVIGGHRVHIEAARHCFAPSCVSISIPGVYSSRRKDSRYRDRNDGVETAAEPAPAKPQAPAVEPVAARPVAPPPSKPSIEPVASAPLPVMAPPPPEVQPLKMPTATAPPPPPTTPPIEIPTARMPPAVNAAPQVLKISHEREDEPADTPLGDWQTEGKTGSVRIRQCGGALCGYLLNPLSNAVGESVLVNMKPKSAELWSGDIHSRDSGSSYYATMAMKGPNSLRVEACVLGQFFCSGNVWSRIVAKPEVTSRQISPQPRS
jgi:uncharacterized protein (DUF2147 family)